LILIRPLRISNTLQHRQHSSILYIISSIRTIELAY